MSESVMVYNQFTCMQCGRPSANCTCRKAPAVRNTRQPRKRVIDRDDHLVLGHA